MGITQADIEAVAKNYIIQLEKNLRYLQQSQKSYNLQEERVRAFNEARKQFKSLQILDSSEWSYLFGKVKERAKGMQEATKEIQNPRIKPIHGAKFEPRITSKKNPIEFSQSRDEDINEESAEKIRIAIEKERQREAEELSLFKEEQARLEKQKQERILHGDKQAMLIDEKEIQRKALSEKIEENKTEDNTNEQTGFNFR